MARPNWCLPAMAVLLLPLGAGGAGPEAGSVVTASFLIQATDPGLQLYLRNKHLAAQSAFAGDRIVLFVHGATYPGETAFDIDLPGGSWMEHAARRGFDAWLVDIRGYGGSTRPPAMDGPAETSPPFATTAEAVQDVASAVDFILGRRGAARLSLVGWSWGTAIVAGYAAEHGDRVHRLALYAPLWIPRDATAGPAPAAYRSVGADAARKRAVRGIPDARAEEISPTAWFDRWWLANLATDPVGSRQRPPVLRAPNGVVQDLLRFWAAGKATYDPARIRVPTLLVVGEWDQDLPLHHAQDLFARLVNAPFKRHVVLGEGTHAMALEKNRMQLIGEVQRFLEEAAPVEPVVQGRKTAAEVVQFQLDAYNAQDLDAFVGTFTDDVIIASAATGQVQTRGKEALRERFGKMFRAFPRCHCRSAELRTEGDGVVLVHEIITGRGPDRPDPWDVGWVRYEVEGGLIRSFVLP